MSSSNVVAADNNHIGVAAWNQQHVGSPRLFVACVAGLLYRLAMTTLRPKDLTEQLTISASTLRLWTEKFGPVLSPGAQKSTAESGGAAQRRFIDEDLETLKRAKRHLAEGKTYEQTLTLLQTPSLDTESADTPVEPLEPAQELETRAASTDTHPVIQAFQEALRAKDETIRAKDETIAELRATIAATVPPKPFFRWKFLERLLTER